ncbi:MAG: hypothetical protein AB2L20_08275 [Mangrovibacterium sp.]
MTPIEDVIPEDILVQLKSYMTIYSGTTPPDIAGTYLVSPSELVFSSDGNLDPGHIFADLYFRLSNQNDKTNILTYEGKQINSEKEIIDTATSDEVSVVGSGDNFTAYFISSGYAGEIYNKDATIISGTKTTSGIKNFSYAFVMLEKGADPDNILIEVGTYRIIKDGNGLASNTTWTKTSKLNSKGISILQSNTSVNR